MATASVYAKLRELVTEVGAVEQRGHNERQDYDYMTAEDLLRAVRKPLADKGLTLVPSLTEVTEREIHTRSGASTITTVTVEFTITDGEGRVDATWAGQGQDPGDKGLGKAYTNCIKTFLRTLLLIPQGQDDPEADPETDRAARDRVEAPAPLQTAASIDVAEGDEDTLRQLCVAHMIKLREAKPESWARVEAWATQRGIDLDDPAPEKLRPLERALRKKVDELGAQK